MEKDRELWIANLVRKFDSIYESHIIFIISMTETRDRLKKHCHVLYGLDGMIVCPSSVGWSVGLLVTCSF